LSLFNVQVIKVQRYDWSASGSLALSAQREKLPSLRRWGVSAASADGVVLCCIAADPAAVRGATRSPVSAKREQSIISTAGQTWSGSDPVLIYYYNLQGPLLLSPTATNIKAQGKRAQRATPG
jgi:hypothetical protein